MSEPKLISPLLDGFVMGTPMSDHDGVCCCPAIKENSDSKYIVKIISIPASQKQLDALLLTGAYKDPAAAMEYFKQLTGGIVKEARILQRLSKMEGYLPIEGCQVVPMEDNQLGYQVYLLSTYKKSLEKHLRRNTMTHLGAVNLGLDMCAALAIARKAGRIYVDLKPGNIFISDEKEYRIGDLGFVKLDSLKYATLPNMYRSRYTAPELHDPMATLNTTVDVYALGLILYQIYNNGQLPFEGDSVAEAFPTPVNADYEIAEIILKACAPKPEDRWQDPIEMGQALVAYMQRNSVNDTPIAPPPAPVSEPEPQPADPDAEAAQPEAEENQELAFMNAMVSDDTAPGEADARDLEGQEFSEEVSSMIAQADELISHEAPEPAVAPEPIDVPIPAPIQEPPKAQEAPEEEDEDDLEAFLHGGLLDEEEEEVPAEAPEEEAPVKKKRKKSFLGPIAVLLVLALLIGGGYYFYRNYYQLTINGLDVDPFEDQITVVVDTEIDTALLTVYCTDTYGNAKYLPITDGKAVFTDLSPDTLYKIELKVSGFHQLVGATSKSCTTATETNIVSFTAITGTEDGSVVLNFTIDGRDTQDWNVTYSAEDEEPQTVSFNGHMVTIKGLTLDKTYTFRLAPASDLYVVGQETLEYTASKVIVAENLSVASFSGSTLTVQWNAPADTEVESWTVRCYSEDGYDEKLTTSETTASFEDIDQNQSYTLEVTAAGMTQSARTNVTANSITIREFKVDTATDGQLTLSWDYDGTAPEGGWRLLYTLDNGETPEVMECSTNSAVIKLRIPGATYHFEVQAADGCTVLGGEDSYKCPNAGVFSAYSLTGNDIVANLLKTPSKSNWSYKDVGTGDYTSTFSSGDSISVLLNAKTDFYVPKDEITILYVIRDSEGSVITDLIGQETAVWYNMWWNTNYHYCELDLPKAPTEAGSYTLSIYFNNAAITSVGFTITE